LHEADHILVEAVQTDVSRKVDFPFHGPGAAFTIRVVVCHHLTEIAPCSFCRRTASVPRGTRFDQSGSSPVSYTSRYSFSYKTKIVLVISEFPRGWPFQILGPTATGMLLPGLKAQSRKPVISLQPALRICVTKGEYDPEWSGFLTERHSALPLES